MKKHLIALAVAGAVAAPAMAQNVTVYGALDYGFQNVDQSGATDQSFTRSTDGVLATSRFGFTGTEDLGGGLKAGFKLQSAYSSGATATAGNLTFGEEGYVFLSGAFGEVRVGRTDISNVESIDSAVGQAGNMSNNPTVNASAADLGGNAASTVRWIGPSMNGLQIQAGWTTANDSAAVTDATTDTSSVGFSYTAGNLAVHGGMTNKGATATAGSGQSQQALGVAYNAGFAKFGAYTAKSDKNATSDNADVSATVLSAQMPIASGLTLHGVYSRASINGTDNASGKGTTVAISKALSKRTTAYAYYTSASSDAAAKFNMPNTIVPNNNGDDVKALGFGIAHKF
jgi:predicted porin